jgi:hypothetical protein
MPQADLSAQQSGYDESQYTTVALEVLEARYPLGAKLVEEGRASDRFMQDCLLAFSQGRRSTFRDAMLGLSTVVHECGHMTDIDRSFDKGFGTVVYVVRPDLVVELPKLDTFHRSEIRQYTGDDDSYASTYLEGQSGMQGFDTLMEEFVQYVNSLMTGYVFAEFYQGGQRSERDGILTFMMYLEYYLKHARANHPQVYGRISGNAEWREFILMMWGRAELALSLTEGMQQLGIDDDAIEQRVRSQELAAEIERLRELHDCR